MLFGISTEANIVDNANRATLAVQEAAEHYRLAFMWNKSVAQNIINNSDIRAMSHKLNRKEQK